jgi:hypothetical protein
MILDFPSCDAFQLTLTSGLIPTSVMSKTVRFGVTEDGRVLTECESKLARASVKSLADLGIARRRTGAKLLTKTASCWMEILPLQQDDLPGAERTPVIFDLPAGDQVAEIVTEMLRLGNDRQSYRVLENGDSSRVLLRVTGPPYYSLLRAVESNGQANGMRAYVERTPGVWIELGSTHPFAEKLRPPRSRLLLIRRGEPWELIPDGPFHDIYESLEFDLPDEAVELTEGELRSKMQVALQLVRGGTADFSELWVLQKDAVEQLDDFVRTSDERLISRLAFAVGVLDGEEFVVVRLRPGKSTPPILVLDGLACASYLKLPNLFVPSGMRIQPPLRRDVVRKLLASRGSNITWLEPSGESGSFVPRTISDAAFRPLADWVEYVLDEETETLSAWSESAQFDFESFVCPDELPDRPKKKPRPEKKKVRRESERPDSAEDEESGDDSEVDEETDGDSKLPSKRPRKNRPAARRKPAELEQQLRSLEKRFLTLDAPLDAAEREPLWVEMARTNAALKLNAEAGLCWTHVFWESSNLDSGLTNEWFDAESQRWISRAKLLAEASAADSLDEILASQNPAPIALASLAAWLKMNSTAPSESDTQKLIAERLGIIQHFLEKFDHLLSTRTSWLAWCAFAKLSGGDELSLARARDRLLERLFQQGLMPDRDVPGFIRAQGMKSGDRFLAVRDQIVDLRGLAKTWSAKHRGTASELTDSYIDLLFSFALARMGEATASHELLEAAGKTLAGKRKDAIHSWYLKSLTHRIGQAGEGVLAVDPLPEDLMSQLDEMPRLDRYKVDKLRQYSRVLEPHETVDPYERWHQRFADELGRKLAELAAIRDRDVLAETMASLLNATTDPASRVRVVAAGLELGPRLGEVLASEVVAESLTLLDDTEQILDQALLLERGLFISGHFGQTETVTTFVGRIHDLLEAQAEASVETIQQLQSLLAQSFTGMRRLGMRDNISHLLDQMAGLVRNAQTRMSGSKNAGDQAELLRTMLQVASGWFFFGHDENAWPVLDEVREQLFSAKLIPIQQTKLACAYAETLGQAPVQETMPRFVELFKRLRNVKDSFTTNTHFALSHIDFVEAVLLAMVSDDFAMNETGRRWLDDDEFLIRRRIHQDVRAAMAGSTE